MLEAQTPVVCEAGVWGADNHPVWQLHDASRYCRVVTRQQQLRGKGEVKMLSFVSFKINMNQMRLLHRGNDQPKIKFDLHNAAKKWKVDTSSTNTGLKLLVLF